jgi:pimeloyl-ACP methyl ester carboxylesterase
MRRLPGARDAVDMSTDQQRAATTFAERTGGGYVDAGDIRTYYEVHGSGDPLVLLHGGFCTVETLDGLSPGLAEHFTVYAPERRGHGRTADVDGPITYTAMAADTIAFLDTVGVSGAHLGLTKHMLPPMLEGLYAASSPDGPAHFDVVAEKLFALYKVGPNMELDELAGITAPVLMMIGDDDICTVEHAAAIRRALPAGRLAVVPDASHSLPMEKPGLTRAIVLDFLAG